MTPLQHVIKITARISWEGRTNGLPEEVSSYVIYTGENPADIGGIIEAEIGTFARYQMMFAQRDQGQIIDLHMTPQDRIGIPFRWIVNFYITVTKLGAELSEANEEGVEVFQDGSKPRVN
jgi:hypothetical protein